MWRNPEGSGHSCQEGPQNLETRGPQPEKWAKWKPDLLIAPENFDAKFLKDFAVWRKELAQKEKRTVSGRTIDIAVTALANVVRWCVVEKWLTEFPVGWHWEAMPEEPAECPLLTDAQVDELCAPRCRSAIWAK